MTLARAPSRLGATTAHYPDCPVDDLDDLDRDQDVLEHDDERDLYRPADPATTPAHVVALLDEWENDLVEQWDRELGGEG